MLMMRTLFALALVPYAAAAAPQELLSGVYSAGELGVLEFGAQDGKVQGKVQHSPHCQFAPGKPIVAGAIEGGVFLGSVTVCQSGANCARERTYPFLAVFHQGALSGHIRFERGCNSPAVKTEWLTLRPAKPEDSQKPTDVLPGNEGEKSEQATQAFNQGQRFIQDQKYARAREQFQQALALGNTRWEAFMGYGLTEVKLGHPQEAMISFDKALTEAHAAKASPSSFAQVHYNRACAQVAMGNAEEALASLRTALKIGGPSDLIEALTDDPDLNPIRTDPDFKRLVSEALLQHNRKKRR